jgi:uncharacterized phage-like protein YoqJ
MKIRASVNAAQLKQFIKLKTKYPKIRDITLYFVCKEGKKWTFDDNVTVSQLIKHDMWSSSALCDANSALLQKSSGAKKLDRIYIVFGR